MALTHRAGKRPCFGGRSGVPFHHDSADTHTHVDRLDPDSSWCVGGFRTGQLNRNNPSHAGPADGANEEEE